MKVEVEDVLAEVENGLQLIEALCDRVSLTLAEDAKTNAKLANLDYPASLQDHYRQKMDELESTRAAVHELFEKVKERDLAACVRAVSVAHALPTIGNAKEQGEKDIALVHRVVKRFVNNQVIEAVFGPYVTCMLKERVVSWLQVFFGEEESTDLGYWCLQPKPHIFIHLVELSKTGKREWNYMDEDAIGHGARQAGWQNIPNFDTAWILIGIPKERLKMMQETVLFILFADDAFPFVVPPDGSFDELGSGAVDIDDNECEAEGQDASSSVFDLARELADYCHAARTLLGAGDNEGEAEEQENGELESEEFDETEDIEELQGTRQYGILKDDFNWDYVLENMIWDDETLSARPFQLWSQPERRWICILELRGLTSKLRPPRAGAHVFPISVRSEFEGEFEPNTTQGAGAEPKYQTEIC